MVHRFCGLADRQAADRIAGQVKLADLFHVLDAQIVIDAALVNSKEKLVPVDGALLGIETRHLFPAAHKPPRCTFRGTLRIVIRGGIFHTLVKRHRNGGAEVRLDAHALLRPHEDFMPVDVGGKVYALLLDIAQLCK